MRIILLSLIFTAGTGFAQVSPADANGWRAYQRRGDEYLRQNDLASAAIQYELASLAAGNQDVALLKQVATLHRWTRHYTESGEWLDMVIARDPSDLEARTRLQQLRHDRGLQLTGGYGDEEIDYTKNAYGFSAFYGSVDWLDVYAGYSRSDKLVYDRSNVWTDAYFFPSYRTYVRFGLQQKRYTYPRSATAPPDDNAYSRVPDIQFELGYHYAGDNYFSVEYESFLPNFYWNSSLHARNYKVGGTIRNWIVIPVYAKLFASRLHDPDPDSFVLDPDTRAVSGFGYENLTLIGGAVGVDNGRLNIEMKYIPDRDLDRSLDWSLFTRVRVNMNSFSVQYDFLYDKYPSSGSRGFSTSQAHMLSVISEPFMALELRGGVKALVRGVTGVSPFLSFRVKTGV